ncbi:hypothetical protein B9Z51_15275 [Limnohabitans sp. T6-5]|uniref:Ig-like domain-containing protein n=1 Tax=Limnohabitans sp. T6-5 TaxID=1100724 RepID=UPI000D37BBF1|nr:Ig-like domain-containing protein [Limnohabitans sp. T6-5]PUE07214.1 hypothetical protein B9Z51_15275 [Limnohabitans sp. T6-5]
MNTVTLRVPHITQALERGQVLALQDVLRLERAGDDLLAWVQQVDGSVQLLRLPGFYEAGRDAVVEVTEANASADKVLRVTAQTMVPPTVLDEQSASGPVPSDSESGDGDVLWLQLLANDLSHTDDVWRGLMSSSDAGLRVLSGVYKPIEPIGAAVLAKPVHDFSFQGESDLSAPEFTIHEVSALGDKSLNAAEAAAGTLISGKTEPNLAVTVTLTQGTQTWSFQTQSNAQGDWSYTLTQDDWAKLQDGPTTLSASSQDPAGNVGHMSLPTFEVHRSLPAAPTAVMDKTGTSAVQTKDNTPGFTGTGPAGGKVRWVLDGNSNGKMDANERVFEVLVGSDGKYATSLATLPADGAYQWVLQSVDKYGNVSTGSTTVALELDTVAPVQILNSVAALSDKVINAAEAAADTVISGKTTANLDVTVTLTQGAQTWKFQTHADAQGDWTCHLTQADWSKLQDGSATLSASSQDEAGNVGQASWPAFDVHTTPPPVPTAVLVKTGTSAVQTNDSTPGFTGTGPAGGKVRWVLDGNSNGVIDPSETAVFDVSVGADGQYSFTFESMSLPPLPSDGAYQWVLQSVDKDGNVSTGTTTVSLELDTVLPVQTLNSVAELIDNVINAAEAAAGTAISGKTDANLAVTVTLKQGAQSWTFQTQANAQGDWTYTLSQADWAKLQEGAATLIASSKDAAGNVGQSNALSFEVHATPPAAPTAEMDKTGASAVQTNDSTPGFTGTGPADGKVRWVLDGNHDGKIDANGSVFEVSVGSDGNYATSLNTLLADGAYQWVLQSVDKYGNVSNGTTTVALELDTVLPVQTLNSVVELNDNVINAAEAAAATALSGKTEPNLDVTVTLKQGSQEWTFQTKANAQGDWTCTLSQADWAELQEGAATLLASSKDGAGNVGQSSELGFEVHATPPEAPTAAMDKTGTSAVQTNDSTPGYTGNGPAEGKVRWVLDGNSNGKIDANESVFEVSVGSDGKYSFNFERPDLSPLPADGPYQWVLQSLDKYGNVSTGNTLVQLELDRQAPLPILNSTGALSDRVINAAEAAAGTAISGKTEPNLDVTVTLKQGLNEWTFQTQANAQGDWAYTLSKTDWTKLQEGAATLMARSQDGAGNVGLSNELNFEVHATPPAAPTAVMDKTGTSAVQTNDSTPGFTGKGPADGKVRWVLDANHDGKIDANESVFEVGVGSDSHYLHILNALTADGAYQWVLQSVDKYGNVSTDTTLVQLELDRQAPTLSLSTVAALDDHVINAAEAAAGTVISGKTDPSLSVTVTLKQGSQEWQFDTQANAQGDWTCTLSKDDWAKLLEGTATLSASSKDAAGNVSQVSLPDFDVHVTPPDAPTAVMDKTGTSEVQTNDNTPGFTGTGPAGGKVRWVLDSNSNGVIDGSEGARSFDVSVGLDGKYSFNFERPGLSALPADGDYQWVLQSVDKYGNVSTGSTLVQLELDSQAPTLSLNSVAELNDKLINAVEAATGTVISGRTDANLDVTVTLKQGSQAWQFQTKAGVDGVWTYTLIQTDWAKLQEGAATLIASSKDAAGNVSQVSLSDFEVHINPPAAPTAVMDKTGTSAVQTKDSTPGFTGMGPAGGKVRWVLDGNNDGKIDTSETAVFDVSVGADGQYSFTFESMSLPPLPADGAYQWVLQSVDKYGNVSTGSTLVQLELDTVRPVQTLNIVAELSYNVINAAEAAAGTAISGNTEPNLDVTVTLKQGLNEWTFQTQANAQGNWTYTLSKDDWAKLQEGAATLSASSKDGAGNVGQSSELSFELHMTPPALPTAAMDKTGTSAVQTKDSTPGFTGTGPADGKVRWVLDSNKDGKIDDNETVAFEVDVDAYGQYSTSLATLLVDGKYQWVLQSVDKYGNVSTGSTTVALELDTQVPVLGLDAVTGDDKIGYQEFVADTGIVLTGQGEAKGVVVLTLSQGSVKTTLDNVRVDDSGHWSVTVSKAQWAAFSSGQVTVSVAQTDGAGNVATPVERSVPIRTTAVAPVTSMVLADGQDTGRDASDGVTYIAAPQIKVSASPNSWVRLVRDANTDGILQASDVVLAELQTDASGHVVWRPSSALGEGVQHILALGWDPVSGSYSNADLTTGQVSNVTARLMLTIDTQAPGAPTLNAVAGDNTIILTESLTDQLVSGTADALADVTLTWSRGLNPVTVRADNSGHWQYTLTPALMKALGGGVVTVTVSQADVAGNVGTGTGSAVITLDTSDLPAPYGLALDASLDTGRSHTDHVTRTTQLTVTGHSGAGNTIEVFDDRNDNAVMDDGESLEAATADAQGLFSVSHTFAVDGSFNLRAIAQDTGGKVSGASQALGVTVDTQVNPVNDLRVSDNDRINLAKRSSGVNISGTGEALADVSVLFKDEGDHLLLTVVGRVDAQHAWSVTLTPAQIELLGQGRLHAEVTQTDVAGNVSQVQTHEFFVDTVPPDEPLTDRVQAALEWNASTELAGGLNWQELADGTTVAVALPANLGEGGVVVLAWGNQQVRYSVTAEELAAGVAQVFVPATTIVAAGDNSALNVSALFEDAAGNTGPWNGSQVQAFQVLNGLSVSFSERPPGMIPVSEDYGRVLSSTYYTHKTQDFRIQLSGAAGSTVVIYEGSQYVEGQALTRVQLDSSGQGVAILSLSEGSHTLQSFATLQGVSAPTLQSTLSVVVDTAVPALPVVTTYDDKVNAVERDAGVLVSGTAEPNAEVKFKLVNSRTDVVGQEYTVLTDGAGQWSTRITVGQWAEVGDGPLSLRLTQTDLAGNTSDPQSVNITLDTTVLAPTVNSVSGNDWVNAQEMGDGSVALSGGSEALAWVSIAVAGSSGTYNTSVRADANGFWSVPLNPSVLRDKLGEGSATVSASQTDAAGNVSVLVNHVFKIDTVVDAPVLDAISGNNIVNAVEAAQGVVVSGSGESGATVQVIFSKGSLALPARSALVGSGGRWQLNLSSDEFQLLGDGAWSVAVSQTDLAGNVSSVTSGTLTVDRTPIAGSVQVNALSTDDVVSFAEQGSDFVVTGTGPAGTQVYLSLQGSLGSVKLEALVVNTQGQWQATLTSVQMRSILGSGPVQVQAWAVDPQTGDRSTQVNTVVEHTFVLEDLEPTPSVNQIGGDGYINALEAAAGTVLTGTGVAGHFVSIQLTGANGNISRLVQVGQDGSWQIRLGFSDLQTLGEGAVQIQAVQRNGLTGGAQTSLPATQQFVMDTEAPNSPHSSDAVAAQSYNANHALAGGVTPVEAAAGVKVAVPLPANARAGDTLELLWGAQVVVHVLTATELAAITGGDAQQIFITVPGNTIARQGDGSVDIHVRVTDLAGNVGDPYLLVSGVAVDAPPLAPQIDAVMTDGYVNLAEFTADQTTPGSILISGTSSSNGAVTVELSRTGTLIKITLQCTAVGGIWTVPVSQTQLLDLGEGTIDMAAYLIDAGLVQSATSNGSFVFDKTLPASVLDVNMQAAQVQNARGELAGGLIVMPDNHNLTEATDGTVVHVGLASDAQSGDEVVLYWGSSSGAGGLEVRTKLTQTDVNQGFVAVTVAESVITLAGDSSSLRVEARSVDRAGNEGERFLVWTGTVDALPEAPTVTAVATDGLVNLLESQADVLIEGAATVGQVVTVKIVVGTAIKLQKTATAVDVNGHPYWSVSLTPGDIVTLGQGTFEIQAYQTDGTGNPSKVASSRFVIDTVPPAPPTLDAVTADNRVSYAESQSGVKLTGTGEPGASISLKLSDQYSHRVSKSNVVVDANGAWTVSVLAADFAGLDQGTLQIAAVQADAAGNVSTVTQKTLTYVSVPVSVPTIVSVSGVSGSDIYFNAQDQINASGNLVVSGSGESDHQLRLDVRVAGVAYDVPSVTVGANGLWSVVLTAADLSRIGQGVTQLQAVQINAAGDESLPQIFDTFVIDTLAPQLNVAQITANGLNGNAKEDDVITVTVQLSEAVTVTALPQVALQLGAQTVYAQYNASASQLAGSNRAVFTYKVVAGDTDTDGGVAWAAQSVDWKGAQVQDAAGNPAGTSISQVLANTVRVDTSAPNAPSIDGLVSPSGGADGAVAASSLGGDYINKVEANQNQVVVKVNLVGTNALAGDSLQVFWGGQQVSPKTLLAGEITQGFAWVTVPASTIGSAESTVDITARLVDLAGNVSGVLVGIPVKVDTIAPGALTMNTVLSDDRVSAVEALSMLGLGAGVSSAQDVTGSGVVVGVTLNAVVRQNGHSYNLTPVNNGTTWSIKAGDLGQVIAQLDDGSWDLVVTQTDAAGNDSTQTVRSVQLDRDVPSAPTILSVPATLDGWINLVDANSGVLVNVSLAGTRAKAGDALVISGFATDYQVVLKTTDLAAQQIAVLVPKDLVLQATGATPQTLNITAHIEDTGGNMSAASNVVGVKLDTIILTPVVVAAAFADGITSAEASMVTGQVFSGSGVEAGASVVITMQGALGDSLRFPTTGQADGTFSVTVMPSDFRVLGSGTVAYTVVQTDKAGNVSTSTTGSFNVVLTLPPPSLFDMTGDNLINAAEASAAQTLSGLASAGAQVKIRFFDASTNTEYLSEKTVTAAASGTWSLSLTAADIQTLSPSGAATILIKAQQSLNNQLSDQATLSVLIDRVPPAVSGAVSLFDANLDGAKNDGLVLTFTEPVRFSDLNALSKFVLPTGRTWGTGARLEASQSQTLNGAEYAAVVKIFLGTGSNLAAGDTITLSSAQVVDVVGNTALSNAVFTVPSLLIPGTPTPPVTIATDNRINATELTQTTAVAFTHSAATAGTQLVVYLDGVVVKRQDMTPNTTSTSVTLTSAEWGAVSGQKSLVAQIVNPTTGATGAYSAPKPIALDFAVESSVQLNAVSDTGTVGAFDGGDKISLVFKEAVNLSTAALPAGLSASSLVAVDGIKQVGDTNTYATTWQVTLGTGTTLQAGQIVNLNAVRDMAGNTATLSTTVRADVFTPNPTLVIDTVAGNNVLDASKKSAGVSVTVQLTGAKAGDVIQLTMDGEVVGTATVQTTGQSSAAFSLAAGSWGGDGERVLHANLVRAGQTTSSLNRSVYVAADQKHWSTVYADTLWFDPDTLMTLKDGSQVMTWTSSDGTVTLQPKKGAVPKLTDSSGHVALYFNGASSLNTTQKTAAPRLDLTGYSDFSMLKLLGYPPQWGYTMSREIDGAVNGTVYAFRHHFGGVQTSLSSHFSGYGVNTVSNAATVSSWMVMNGFNDTTAGSLAVNNRVLSSTANSTMMSTPGKFAVGAAGTLAIGASGGTGSGSAEFVTGVMGDQIAFNHTLTAAMRGEVSTYLAAKYQTVGRLVAVTGTAQTYDLSLSQNATPILDDLLQLNTSDLGAGKDRVITAGADYVNTSAGDDTIEIKDAFFRQIDGGKGLDTLVWSNAYSGSSKLYLSDFVSNFRGDSGATADNTRVNAAGYHQLLGIERLDLTQSALEAGAVGKQVLTIASADVGQLSETNTLEVMLGGQDVLLTTSNDFSSRVSGNFLNNGVYFDTRYQKTVNGEDVTLYVKGGSGDPDPNDLTLTASALQLNFSAAMYGAAPVVGDFSITAWSNGSLPGLTSVDSVNVKQGLYFGFNGAVTEPMRIDYTGTLADETGRSFLHKTWGVGTDGGDTLDASTWTVAAAILGGGGNDAITGTAYADVLVGGLGADRLTGGLGSDRFVYKTVYQGVGGAGGLGGLTGDVVTDFNTSLGKDADVLDMSDLFASSLGATGQAVIDATKLIKGGYIDLVKTNAGHDLQVFVDRDGGGAMGLLVTLQNMDSYLTVPGETTEQLLQRLLTEGRMQVSHA